MIKFKIKGKVFEEPCMNLVYDLDKEVYIEQKTGMELSVSETLDIVQNVSPYRKLPPVQFYAEGYPVPYQITIV